MNIITPRKAARHPYRVRSVVPDLRYNRSMPSRIESTGHDDRQQHYDELIARLRDAEGLAGKIATSLEQDGNPTGAWNELEQELLELRRRASRLAR